MKKCYCDHCNDVILGEVFYRTLSVKHGDHSIENDEDVLRMELCVKCTAELEGWIFQFAPTGDLGRPIVKFMTLGTRHEN